MVPMETDRPTDAPRALAYGMCVMGICLEVLLLGLVAWGFAHERDAEWWLCILSLLAVITAGCAVAIRQAVRVWRNPLI